MVQMDLDFVASDLDHTIGSFIEIHIGLLL
jgi:hypothetical protein